MTVPRRRRLPQSLPHRWLQEGRYVVAFFFRGNMRCCSILIGCATYARTRVIYRRAFGLSRCRVSYSHYFSHAFHGVVWYSQAADVVLPLEVGTKVNCMWRDNKWHQVKYALHSCSAPALHPMRAPSLFVGGNITRAARAY
eukprot:214037-Pyramimonas_sp.AAC.1